MPVKLIKFGLLLIAILGLCEGLWQLNSQLKFTRAIDVENSIVSNTPSYLHRGRSELIMELYHSWSKAMPNTFILPEGQLRLGKSTLLLSSLTQRLDEKARLFCLAKESFKKAVRLSPHDTRYQIALADIDKAISDPNYCEKHNVQVVGKSNQMPPIERLEWAEVLGPNSIESLYLAAVVYLGFSEREKAFQLLRKNQIINPHFSDEQREYVYNLVVNEKELELALPNQYPNIVHWIDYFSKNRSADYQSWQNVFVSSLLKSLKDLENKLKAKKISNQNYSKYLKKVANLALVNKDESLRKRLDLMLASVYRVEGQLAWADYLTKRSNLSTLDYLTTRVVDDENPRFSMLYGWISKDSPIKHNFNKLNSTLGVYIPRGNQLKSVVINNALSVEELDLAKLKIHVSKDNLSFYQLGEELVVSAIDLDRKQKVKLDFLTSDFRFVKISYLGNKLRTQLENSSDKLLEVYGKKS